MLMVVGVARFRKRPVVVDAWQWDGFDVAGLDGWLDHWAPFDNWPTALSGNDVVISTLEGEMRAIPGDWIIRGVRGEFYPCKPDIFDATYEAAG